MFDLLIRDALPSDRETIISVTIAAFEQYTPIMGTNWVGYRDNIVETLGNLGSAEQIVAEVNGMLVGTVLLIPAGPVINLSGTDSITREFPEIRLLAVAPSARGHGVGRALAQECLRRVREDGGSVLTLHTTDMMHKAMQMYEGIGFQRDPGLDWRLDQEIMIKGYRFNID